jgi:hypothetical protein
MSSWFRQPRSLQLVAKCIGFLRMTEVHGIVCIPANAASPESQHDTAGTGGLPVARSAATSTVSSNDSASKILVTGSRTLVRTF